MARVCCLLCVACAVPGTEAQEATRDQRIKPEELGLPAGNERTSEPFVARVYKTDNIGRILKKQPAGFPFTVEEDYLLKDGEKVRTHQGVDFSSRPEPGSKPTPLDFKAGVHGIVVKGGDGPWGTITVQIHDGSLIQYLHTSASHVKVGDVVAPDTKLGVTGRTGAGVIHLHVQTKDKSGSAISPDLAFRLGKKKLYCEEKPEDKLIEFDPELYCPVRANVTGRKVSAVVHPEAKWVVEMIGRGGRVDLVLGEFYDYRSASHCAVSWSRSNPKDLRLTREREIRLDKQNR